MYSIGFLDFKPSIHHERIVRFLNKFFHVKSLFTIDGDTDLIFNNIDALLVGELNHTLHLISKITLPKIGVSWARDIKEITSHSNSMILQNLLILDLILVDCEYHRINLINLGIDPKKIIKFPYGVDFSEYKFVQKKKYTEKIVIYSNRAWEPGYGQETLLRTFRGIALTDKDITLRMAGEGTTKSNLLREFKELSQSGRLVNLGNVTQEGNIKELIESDIFISASESDGISVSILESMAIGTPVISCDIPTNREIIKHGVNGLLFRENDSNNLRNLIDTLIMSQKLRLNLAIKSRQFIDLNADWIGNMHRFKHKIESLL
jgi:glycosyltransferase involved in cell wall biosynthesis